VKQIIIMNSDKNLLAELYFPNSKLNFCHIHPSPYFTYFTKSPSKFSQIILFILEFHVLQLKTTYKSCKTIHRINFKLFYYFFILILYLFSIYLCKPYFYYDMSKNSGHETFSCISCLDKPISCERHGPVHVFAS
jgi:hypothetical protein